MTAEEVTREAFVAEFILDMSNTSRAFIPVHADDRTDRTLSEIANQAFDTYQYLEDRS